MRAGNWLRKTRKLNLARITCYMGNRLSLLAGELAGKKPRLEQQTEDKAGKLYTAVSLIPRPFPLPVFHRFQYEIQRGKTWEIWSRAMPSSRQHGRHTEGGAQRRILTSCVVLSIQWLDIRAFARQTIDTVRCSQRGDGSTRNRYFNGWAPPPVCLPSVYLTSSHVTRSPRPSPAVFHTGSDEILAVGMAWERGYIDSLNHSALGNYELHPNTVVTLCRCS